MRKIINFLKIFMPETLSKRLVCMVLLGVGIPIEQIESLTGFCSKTIKSVQKNLTKDGIDGLFKISGGGRKSKTKDVEKEIVDEINTNQYHSRQQIADMILEKYGIKISLSAVGELLKKTKLSG
jgi:transposase